ncbi:MAG: hypothetical protein H6613_07170 [Ignavibacteriales bacterium]|nr:hypothetical protein [Ignavibacteriales bacterium]
MGFSTLIDILGSSLIGGLILLILLRMNDSTVENSYLNSGEMIVQSNLLAVVELLEHDFRKIGYCEDYDKLAFPELAIRSVTDTSITFLTDVSISKAVQTGDGIVDTLKYYVGSPLDSEVMGTPNPKDRMLYRQVNHDTPFAANLGLTEFRIKYFDNAGNEITTMPSTPPLGIITMQIDITVENSAAYGDENDPDNEVYSKDKSAFWRQIRLSAPGLSIR